MVVVQRGIVHVLVQFGVAVLHAHVEVYQKCYVASYGFSSGHELRAAADYVWIILPMYIQIYTKCIVYKTGPGNSLTLHSTSLALLK
jgi:hypothetical protein